jgi:hypothetical protein
VNLATKTSITLLSANSYCGANNTSNAPTETIYPSAPTALAAAHTALDVKQRSSTPEEKTTNSLD